MRPRRARSAPPRDSGGVPARGSRPSRVRRSRLRDGGGVDRPVDPRGPARVRGRPPTLGGTRRERPRVGRGIRRLRSFGSSSPFGIGRTPATRLSLLRHLLRPRGTRRQEGEKSGGGRSVTRRLPDDAPFRRSNEPVAPDRARRIGRVEPRRNSEADLRPLLRLARAFRRSREPGRAPGLGPAAFPLHYPRRTGRMRGEEAAKEEYPQGSLPAALLVGLGATLGAGGEPGPLSDPRLGGGGRHIERPVYPGPFGTAGERRRPVTATSRARARRRGPGSRPWRGRSGPPRGSARATPAGSRRCRRRCRGRVW